MFQEMLAMSSGGGGGIEVQTKTVTTYNGTAVDTGIKASDITFFYAITSSNAGANITACFENGNIMSGSYNHYWVALSIGADGYLKMTGESTAYTYTCYYG